MLTDICIFLCTLPLTHHCSFPSFMEAKKETLLRIPLFLSSFHCSRRLKWRRRCDVKDVKKLLFWEIDCGLHRLWRIAGLISLPPRFILPCTDLDVYKEPRAPVIPAHSLPPVILSTCWALCVDVMKAFTRVYWGVCVCVFLRRAFTCQLLLIIRGSRRSAETLL